MLYLFLFLFSSLLLFAETSSVALGDSERLFADLKKVDELDKKIHDQLPLIINYQLQGGYFTMPSARTYEAGQLGVGFAWVPPYQIGSLAFQFFDRIETTGTYWIYHGIQDKVFGHLGFGDEADRTANIKWNFLSKKDGFPFIPDFAVGWNDFIGSRHFSSFYVVATKEFCPYNFEATLGWGNGRIEGFFGGLAWTPFRRANFLLKNLSLVAEYDANNYKHHLFEHCNGRIVKNRINAGLQLKLWDLFQLSASTIRGTDWAAAGSFHYNFGSTKGLFPKIYDRPVYQAPIDTEPVGAIRKQEELAQELAFAFKEQGLDLYSLYLVPTLEGQDDLWMKVINVRYREEEEVRERLEHILAALTPSNLKTAVVVLEADGIVEHEYRFRIEDLKRYREGGLGDPEFAVISPMKEASSTPSIYDATQIYHRKKTIWLLTFRPWFATFFGSSRGKFKYETGLVLGSEGYLFNQIYYGINGTVTALSSVQHLQPQDILNPSRIINVRTDTILYHQSGSFHLDQAYLQKSWNWGKGCFSRLAAGYFETAYGGLCLETLYYPVASNWALGFEVSPVWKRSYYGLGFNKIRQYTAQGYQWFPYNGLQYFVDFYYDYKPYNLDFRIRAGQFLARDKGIRIEGGRTFSSGLRVGLWYTLTNGNDVVNNHRYYDKGFSISFPLDLFLNKSSRTRLTYGMSAWLRDVGAVAATGKPLYQTLYWERYNYGASRSNL
jgi:hypothetical protein